MGNFQPLDLHGLAGAVIAGSHALGAFLQYLAEALVFSYQVDELERNVDIAPFELQSAGVFSGYDTFFIKVEGEGDAGAAADGIETIAVDQSIEMVDGAHVGYH